MSFLNHTYARAPICSPLMKTQCECQRVMSRLGLCNCLVEQLVSAKRLIRHLVSAVASLSGEGKSALKSFMVIGTSFVWLPG